jgi:hypothetical protein
MIIDKHSGLSMVIGKEKLDCSNVRELKLPSQEQPFYMVVFESQTMIFGVNTPIGITLNNFEHLEDLYTL